MGFLWTAFGGYLLLLGLMFSMQRSMMYPASRASPEVDQAGVAGLKEISVETADGLTLTHWYRPPRRADAPVVVVYHGNAGHIGHRVPKFAPLFDTDLGVLLAEYRGYGGNPGRPTEATLTQDAGLVLDWLIGQGVAPERLVLYGESLGCGVAVKMAAERSVGALILEAPYTSIADVAQAHYWYLPARWLVLDRWDVLPAIDKIDSPLLIIHGERDTVVPTRFDRTLHFFITEIAGKIP